MRYEFSGYEWAAIRLMLPNKPRGVPRVDDQRVLNGIFWVLRPSSNLRPSGHACALMSPRQRTMSRKNRSTRHVR